MADDRIIIEILTTSKGLKMSSKDAEKLSQAVEKTDKAYAGAEKSGKKYHKQEKALYQSNLSTAKGFSKMKETMGGGSSGLVGAYATLAANVFAATAAFNALRQAAQVQTLVEGFGFLADVSGRTASVISANIREITGNALSMEESFRASAIAVTSGFSTTQLERLVAVGKNASIALGRNLGDAVDRLIRGVAKLEPEILDELGIMVRLDTATQQYAARLGKVATELTDFERRQAFLNATIEQGEEKYAALGSAVDVNQFDKLAGTFSNLSHNVLAFISSALTPLIALFANSQVAMLGALIFFGKGVVTTMFPMLTSLGERFANTAMKAHDAADVVKSSAQKAFETQETKIGGIKSKKSDPAGFQQMQKDINAGTGSIKQYKKTLGGLRRSESLRKTALDKEGVKDKDRKEKELARIRKLIKETEKLVNLERKRGQASTKAARTAGKAAEQDILAGAAANIGASGGLGGFGQAWAGMKDFNAEVNETDKNVRKTFGKGAKGRLQGFGQTARNAFKKGAGGVRLFGAAAINAIPGIGQIIFIVGTLWTIMSKLFGSSEKLTKAINQFGEVAESSAKKMRTLRDVIEGLEEQQEEIRESIKATTNTVEQQQLAWRDSKLEAMKYNAELKVTAGILTEFASAADNLGEALEDEAPTRWTMATEALKDNWKEATGETLSWLSVVKHSTGPVGDLVKWLQEPTDAPDADKFKLFGNTVKDNFEKISDPKTKAKLTELFGKDGIEGWLTEMAPKAGETFEQAQERVTNAINKTAAEVSREDAAVTSLGKGYEELSKKIVAYADRARKKNQFTVMSGNMKDFNKQLKEVIITSGGVLDGVGGAREKLKTQLPPEMMDQYKNLGITYDNILENVEVIRDKEGNIVDVILKGKTAELQDQFDIHGKAVDLLKSETAEHKAQVKLLKAQNKLSLIKLENEFKARQLRLKGTDELTPQQEMRMAIETHKKSMQMSKDQSIADQNFQTRSFLLGVDEINLRADLDEKGKKLRIEQLGEEHNRKMELIRVEAEYTQEQLGAARIAAFAKAGTTGTASERAAALFDTGESGTEESAASALGKIETARRVMVPFMEDMKKLGPDGEFVSSAVSGMFTIANSVEMIGESGLKSAEGLEAVASIIGAIGGMMAANSKRQIGNIDKQIAAEKKRDGKSKESLAKIKAMEKKKEGIERKAFEMRKKMMIAQTIASTAAAVMSTMEKGGFWVSPLAMAVAAMGAAQVALIAKQKFEGGSGSADAVGAPQSIEIGKRSNRIDVSRSASGGELAYLRGEKGIASRGAQSFVPTGGAAGLRRGYAAGGPILVGEQGPEVIQPRGQGYEVLPNSQVMGGTTSANFTINAVDAAGVEEVLTNQRGNIISMIREAAHDHGEEFIEAVNTDAYGDSSSSGSWTGKGGG